MFIYTDVFVCAHVVCLIYSTVCMYIHVLLTHTSMYIQLLKYLLYFADSYPYTIRADIYIRHKTAIHRCPASILYSALQHRHQALSSHIGVDSCGMCAQRSKPNIHIGIGVYNNTCYTDIADIQQPTYATMASSIYNNIHIYLYTQIQSYTRSHTV